MEWCACFISWCANERECVYTEIDGIPKFADCAYRCFIDRQTWFMTGEYDHSEDTYRENESTVYVYVTHHISITSCKELYAMKAEKTLI